MQKIYDNVVREKFPFDVPIGFYENQNFIGTAQKSIELREKISKIAKSDFPVLLLGESGSGKTHIAKMIHNLSLRKFKPFFDDNIAAINENVAETELFGCVEGAFTDSKNRVGYFEKADGGTLFLDEIGESSLSLQRKLLKVIEDGEFYRVGSSDLSKVNVRLICATNVDLKEKISKKLFREDLFYRIADFVIKIPPLRERKDDIPLLCDFFLKKQNYNKVFSEKALEAIMDFSWPGNVRQLQSTINRAVFNADKSDLILPEHIEIY